MSAIGGTHDIVVEAIPAEQARESRVSLESPLLRSLLGANPPEEP